MKTLCLFKIFFLKILLMFRLLTFAWAMECLNFDRHNSIQWLRRLKIS